MKVAKTNLFQSLSKLERKGTVTGNVVGLIQDEDLSISSHRHDARNCLTRLKISNVGCAVAGLIRKALAQVNSEITLVEQLRCAPVIAHQ